MTDKNIVLVGFMGSGKSMVSKELAKRLERDVYSTDGLIERAQDRTIPEIFEKEGESFFRSLEKEVVSDCAGKTGIIIDCGGGVVIDPENIGRLRTRGILFYLEASPESVYEQIKDDTNRPLLEGEDPLKKIKNLMDKRQDFYRQADYTIDADFKTIPEMSDSICAILEGLKDDS